LGEVLLHVWPVTRSVTRLLTSDVSDVPLCLGRNAELRFVGRIAAGRDTWDAVAGSKPSGRTWDLADRSLKCHLPVVGRHGAAGGIPLRSVDGAIGCTYDHIGSTTVPGLSAKVMTDLQIRMPQISWVGSPALAVARTDCS
jgi:hypothetical protein